ncbi:MAG: hypothetical protein RI928_2604 [Pseudomonadota bacterium]
MDVSGSYISMPVIRTESDRGDDERSKQEKQKQNEHRLPRMRIGEKQKSEKMLSDAMNMDTRKNSTPMPKQFPKPASVITKQSQAQPEINPEIKPQSQKNLQEENEVKEGREEHQELLTSKDLHDLEDRLFERGNTPELPDVVADLKGILNKTLKRDFSKTNDVNEKSHQEEMLCSLDFIEGYLAVPDNAKETQAELAEVIDALRQKIMNQPLATGFGVTVQQEGLIQVLGNSKSQSSIQKDSLGHSQLVVEVGDEVIQDVVSSANSAKPVKDKRVEDRKPGDDSLPLIVQRSI